MGALILADQDQIAFTTARIPLEGRSGFEGVVLRVSVRGRILDMLEACKGGSNEALDVETGEIVEIHWPPSFD